MQGIKEIKMFEEQMNLIQPIVNESFQDSSTSARNLENRCRWQWQVMNEFIVLLTGHWKYRYGARAC